MSLFSILPLGRSARVFQILHFLSHNIIYKHTEKKAAVSIDNVQRRLTFLLSSCDRF